MRRWITGDTGRRRLVARLVARQWARSSFPPSEAQSGNPAACAYVVAGFPLPLRSAGMTEYGRRRCDAPLGARAAPSYRRSPCASGGRRHVFEATCSERERKTLRSRKLMSGDTSRRRYAAPLAVLASPTSHGRLCTWTSKHPKVGPRKPTQERQRDQI